MRTSMKMLGVAGLAAAVLTAPLAVSHAQGPAAAPPAVLGDGAGAKTGRIDGVHQARYIELFFAGREAGTGNLVAACFNTMFTPKGLPASKDTAPQALVAALDMEKLKAEYGVMKVALNGPKLWQPDWSEAEIGAVRDFGGIPAAWVAQLNVSAKGGLGEEAPYQPMTIKRTSRLGWNKGTTVLLLEDPAGTVWVMKGFQVGLAPRYTYEQFVAAGQGQFKKLPPGWKFRVKKLEQDLIEVPEGGVATIMPDEFFNVYDKTGPGMTNYKP